MNSVACIDYETTPFFKIVAKMLIVTEVGALSVSPLGLLGMALRTWSYLYRLWNITFFYIENLIWYKI